jgi:hypothetical protein
MPSVKHANSEAGFMTPVAGAASVPPTQVDLAYGGNYLFEEYQSNESVASLTAGNYVSFTVNPNVDAMTDIGESFITVTGFYQTSADILVANSTVSAPPFLSAFLLNDFTMTINGTQVSDTLTMPNCVCLELLESA